MVDQRVTSLDELSDTITDFIIPKIDVFVDQQKVAQAVLDAIARTGKADMRNVPTVILEDAIEQAIHHAYNEEIILEVITECLIDAGFTNDPPAKGATKKIAESKIAEPVAAAAPAPLKPAVSMDVTALREQVLGLSTPSSQIPV
jgi:hypothetical protein